MRFGQFTLLQRTLGQIHDPGGESESCAWWRAAAAAAVGSAAARGALGRTAGGAAPRGRGSPHLLHTKRRGQLTFSHVTRSHSHDPSGAEASSTAFRAALDARFAAAPSPSAGDAAAVSSGCAAEAAAAGVGCAGGASIFLRFGCSGCAPSTVAAPPVVLAASAAPTSPSPAAACSRCRFEGSATTGTSSAASGTTSAVACSLAAARAAASVLSVVASDAPAALTAAGTTAGIAPGDDSILPKLTER